MLSKCANPACSTPFRRLREGKLFVVETENRADGKIEIMASRRARPLRRVEHFWLCDGCSRFITLAFDRDRGMITVPLPDGLGTKMVTLAELPGRPGNSIEREVMAPMRQARSL